MLDEGIEHTLDLIQETAAINAVLPYSHAYNGARNVPHGTVTRHVYHSEVTGGERELYVYTPPGYDRGMPTCTIKLKTKFCHLNDLSSRLG